MSFDIKQSKQCILFDDSLKKRFTCYQNFIPLYECYFNTTTMEEWNTMTLEYPEVISSLKSTDHYNLFEGYNEKTKKTISIFAKFCPLFDPIRVLLGKTETNKYTLPKLGDKNHIFGCKNNSAYVDSFFSYLTSQMLHKNEFVHGLDSYGSLLGIKRNFRIDIRDDIEYLFDSDYFLKNRELFNISDEIYDYFEPVESSKYKKRLEILDEPIELNIDELNIGNMYSELPNSFKSSDLVYIKQDTKVSRSRTKSSSTCSSRTSGTMDDENNLNSDSDSDSDGDSDGDCDSDDNPIYATISEFPITMVLLETCQETLDTYMSNNEVSQEEWSAIFMQILMTLIVYQEKFYFIHNDLHDSNIMYVSTNKEYLYYKYNSIYYKVPTFGKIWKIIDFGRAIYKYKGNVIFSDSFSNKGDASTQYNCEPYLNPKKTIVPPNFSFDLCRLACSLYDYFDEESERLSSVKEIIDDWIKDDKGRNILYKKNGDERYPDFKLYKMITRSVHNHIPKYQLEKPIFSQYSISRKNIRKNKKIMKIDTIPKYVD